MRKVMVCLLLWVWGASVWAQAPVPLLWKVSDADNSIYLLGSFHMLKPSDYPLAPSVDKAFADSQQLYLELSPQEANSPELSAKLMQAGVRTDGKSLQQVLSAPTWSALQDYVAKTQTPLTSLQAFKPWLVALMLTLTETQKLQAQAALGLDAYFMDRAAKSGKPAHGLESAEAQFAAMDSLSPELQDAFLLDTLDEMKDFEATFEELHGAWRRGDAAALERLSFGGMQTQYPALHERLYLQRNYAWLPRLDALLREKRGAHTMVVVGAMHLLGNDGLVRLLEAKGYRVERLR